MQQPISEESLTMANRFRMLRLNELAAKYGGTADINPQQDLGYMYNRNLADPNGHVWEMMWMEMSAFQAGCVRAGPVAAIEFVRYPTLAARRLVAR